MDIRRGRVDIGGGEWTLGGGGWTLGGEGGWTLEVFGMVFDALTNEVSKCEPQ